MKMRSKTVKPPAATWRLWSALALGVLGSLSAVLSIRSNIVLLCLGVSVLITARFGPILAVVQASPVVALTSDGFSRPFPLRAAFE